MAPDAFAREAAEIAETLRDDRADDVEIEARVVVHRDVAEAHHALEARGQLGVDMFAPASRSKASRLSWGMPSRSFRTRGMARAIEASQAR